MIKILAIVVTYNRLELLKDAIKSLRYQETKCDILVVNNGSTDGSGEWLDTQDGLIIIHQDNVGGAGGFYTGLKYAAEHGYDFAWIMDDDIEANPSTLKELCDGYNYLVERGETPGFLCSKVVNLDGETTNVPVISDKRNSVGSPQWDKYLNYGLVEIKLATFVSVYIPTCRIREVGLPYKDFFIWGDDTEYTLRISTIYKSYLAGKSLIIHKRLGNEGLSILKMTDPRRFKMYSYLTRNHMFLARKGLMGNGGIRNQIRYNLKIILRLTLKGRFQKAKIVMSGMCRGFYFNPKINFPDIT